MRCILRTVFLTIVRFFVLLASLVALAYLDVRPLPEWTLTVAAYAIHAAVTWMFAAWAFRKYYPTWTVVGIVCAIFILGGMALEAGLYLLLAPRASVAGIAANYSWHTPVLIVIYAAAIVYAGWRARIKHAPTMPEGVVT